MSEAQCDAAGTQNDEGGIQLRLPGGAASSVDPQHLQCASTEPLSPHDFASLQDAQQLMSPATQPGSPPHVATLHDGQHHNTSPADEAGEGALALLTCSMCGQRCDHYVVVRKATGSSPDVLRCNSCNALQSRVTRALGTTGLTDKWAAMSKADKKAFFQTSHELAGEDLKAAIKTVITNTFVDTKTSSFNVDSDWLDEEDLTKAFDQKPEQLAHIKANASTMFCPVRGVKFYEVPKYTTRRSDKAEAVLARDTRVETEQFRKRKVCREGVVEEAAHYQNIEFVSN